MRWARSWQTRTLTLYLSIIYIWTAWCPIYNSIIVLPLIPTWKNIHLTYTSKSTFFVKKLPSCNNVKIYIYISYILRNHLVVHAAFVHRFKILSFATSSSQHACVPPLLRLEHPVLVIYTAASPEVHRNENLSSYRGVHAILSVVFCTLHTPRCGLLLQTTKQYLPL